MVLSCPLMMLLLMTMLATAAVIGFVLPVSSSAVVGMLTLSLSLLLMSLMLLLVQPIGLAVVPPASSFPVAVFGAAAAAACAASAVP